MPAGLQVINDHGSVLFDENYRNLAVRTSGQLTIPANGVTALSATSGIAPHLAFSAPSPVSVLGGWTNAWNGTTPNTVTWTIYGAAGTVVKYWVYDVLLTSSNRYGLQVFDASGRLTFDSSFRYCKFEGVYRGDTTAQWQGGASYTPGRTLAVLLATAPGEMEIQIMDDGQPRSPYGNLLYRVRRNLVTASVISNTVSFGWRIGEWGDWSDRSVLKPPPGRLQDKLEALILDMT